MVTVVEAETALVLTVNVALVAPATTVTLAGTRATVVLLLESATCAPPAGAGPLNVTAPVDEFPPVTLVGLNVSGASVGAGGAQGVASGTGSARHGSPAVGWRRRYGVSSSECLARNRSVGCAYIFRAGHIARRGGAVRRKHAGENNHREVRRVGREACIRALLS